MSNWSWKDSPELMDRLISAQNSLLTPIDIVTYAGWCGDEASLKVHVERYEMQVAQQVIPVPRKRRTGAAVSRSKRI